MDVISLCALRTASLNWQPRIGAHALTVICKATFDLRPTESPLSDSQVVVWGPTSAVPMSDMVPFKRRADVVVIGRAFPPQHTTMVSPRSLFARLSVGNMQKATEVRAEQNWIVPGLGPIPPHAPARMALLGRHAATWDHTSWNTRPMPDDLDGAYFSAVPPDQQIADLVGGEAIALEYLHPTQMRFETRLVPIVPHASVHRLNGETQDVRLRCDTLCIDTIHQVAFLVWRGVVMLTHAMEGGVVKVTAICPPGTSSPDEWDASQTLVPMARMAMAVPILPFVPKAIDLSTQSVSNARVQWIAPTESRNEDCAQTILTLAPMLPTAAMPFVARHDSQIKDLDAAVVDAASYATSSNQEHHDGGDQMVLWGVPPPDTVGPLVSEMNDIPIRDVQEPPLIGPLAAMSQPALKALVVESAPVVENQMMVESSIVATALTESIELTLVQFAALSAELVEPGAKRAKILDSYGLDERTLRINEERWKAAIKEEAGEGRQELRATYDESYVARVERFRGLIMLDEYARLVVALERGRTRAVLESLRLQKPALMPIVRLWTKKLISDMKLSAEASEALRVARTG